MSHTTTIRTELRNLDILKAACTALGIPFTTGPQKIELFAGYATGDLSFKLPGWHYPAVVNSQTGEVKLDNYGGQWGNIEEFHKLSQEYSLQVAENEAAEFTLLGWTVERQKQPNGDILLVIQQ